MMVEVKNVSKTYKTADIEFKALKNVSFTLEEGKIMTILGPSGSGKSTLLNILGGIDLVSEGSVIVDNKEITNLNEEKLCEYRKKSIGFVFQFYNLISNLTVYENVEVVANITKNPLDINEILRAVGMENMKDRFPKELSGGQQQRVAIARALVKKPKVLLCDEPTGALDFETSKEILKLIDEINKKYNTTVIIITHNEAISSISHRVIRLKSGLIEEDKNNNEINSVEGIDW